MSDLAEILEGSEEPVEQIEQVEPVETPRDEHGRFAATGEEEAPSPVAEEPEVVPEATPEPVAPKEDVEDTAAVVAGLKAELARIRHKLREQEPPKPEQPKVDFWENPDQALGTLEGRVDEKLTRFKIDWSEQAARGRYTDFEEKAAIFSQMAEANPALIQQMVSQADPAEFAYKAAKSHQKLKEVGDLDSYEAKIRADERAKIEASMNTKIEAEIQKRLNVPKSLSNARATGGNANVAINEPLEDILGR